MAATISKPVGGKPDKLIRDALMAAVRQSPQKLKMGAEKMLDKFAEGDKDAMQFFADRIDGKAVQPISGADDEPPIKLSGKIEIVHVKAGGE